MRDSVTVLGAVAWNVMFVLDVLPDPVPHITVALDSWDTEGATSAGKASHVNLMTPAGERLSINAGVDTNGAGDAFFAGTLTAILVGATTGDALQAGAGQATRALTIRDLGPGLS